MITKVNAYQSSDGTAHSSLEEAQKAEIVELFKGDWETIDVYAIADLIIKNSAAIIDILTTTPTSKPKARKVNGGTKKRTPKATTEPLPLVTAEEVKK